MAIGSMTYFKMKKTVFLHQGIVGLLTLMASLLGPFLKRNGLKFITLGSRPTGLDGKSKDGYSTTILQVSRFIEFFGENDYL